MTYSKRTIGKYPYLILLFIFLMIGLFLAPVSAEASSNSPRIILNNEQLSFEVAPIIENGRTLVPVRTIFEAMGAEVTWNAASRVVTASKGAITVTLPINSVNPKVNGTNCKLDVSPKIINGRTLAPLRFVGEAFGGRVTWDSNTRTININNASAEKPVAVKIKPYLLNLRNGPSTLAAITGQAASGEILPVLAEQDGWFKVSRGSQTGWLASWYVESRTTLDPDPAPQAQIVVLDAGHGGYDPGALGDVLKEKDVNLRITLKVGEILKQNGMTVVYTRDNDSFVGLEERSIIANDLNARLFVAIHNNASESSSLSGTETYFYAPSDNADLYAQRAERMRLASALQSALASQIQRKNLGVKEANLSVLRNTMMPSALVEVAFISNPAEEALMQTDDFINKAATGIANGIISYLNS